MAYPGAIGGLLETKRFRATRIGKGGGVIERQLSTVRDDKVFRWSPRVKSALPWFIIGGIGAMIFAIRLVYPLLGPPLVLNTTRSEPYGVYWLTAHPSQRYERGQLVTFSMPAAFKTLIVSRGWAASGVALLKGIGALEGDRICADDHYLTINGTAAGPIARVDSAGRELPRIRGCYVVSAGYFLPLSTFIPNSFDGRYMGPQPLSLIEGEAHRLWTF
jgi:conjugative transfer signal peptidase TraF